MIMADGTPVLVTGASGFIATHIIQQLQQAGYKVRGTVRSLQNEEKVKPLRELTPEAKYPLELVEADLTKEDGWKEAVSGCTYVLHTASPLPMQNPKNEMEVIGPAVDGTLAVMKACREAGGVKRVVLTSSIAAITPGDKTASYSEADWADEDSSPMAYYKSKTLAEKAAWDFVKNLPDDDKFELAVINPSMVTGPVLCGGYAASLELPKRLLERLMPALPRLNMPFVDVRDVAAAHIAAMTEPEAAGHRHIVSSENFWVKDIATFYVEEFGPLGYKIPTWVAPYFLLRVGAIFDKTIHMVLPLWGKVVTLDNTRMRTVLKIEPRSEKESLLEQAYSMIERGFVKKTAKYIKMKDSQS